LGKALCCEKVQEPHVSGASMVVHGEQVGKKRRRRPSVRCGKKELAEAPIA